MSHCQSFLDITGALLVLVNAAHENNIINTTIDTHIFIMAHLQLIEGDRGESGSTSRGIDGVRDVVTTKI